MIVFFLFFYFIFLTPQPPTPLIELQHTAKKGKDSQLPKYEYGADIPWASKNIIQSISCDAGSGLKAPFCRVGYAYFSRVLVTNVYHICDHGAKSKQPNSAYLWNDTAGGKGPAECISIFLDYIMKNRTGAERLVVELDGCSGQLFNKFFFAICEMLVDPTSDLCRQFGCEEGKSVFLRIDVIRGEVGHTFMLCDRVHGIIRNTCRKRQWIVNIDEHAQIIAACAHKSFKVTLIKAGDGFFRDMKKYVEQAFKLSGNLADIDNNPIATRKQHWANFGVGPSGGDDSVTCTHNYGAWRLRKGYSPLEVPTEIVVGRHTRPRRSTGDYTLIHESLGAYERSLGPTFLHYGDAALGADWMVEREITPEKVRDTHKLACLGLPPNKIRLWPCPDPTTCKHDRCPESLFVAGGAPVGVVQV